MDGGIWMILLNLAFLFATIAGISKGVRDTIKHHWIKSVFNDEDYWVYWTFVVLYTGLFKWSKYGNIDYAQSIIKKIMVWIKSDDGSMKRKHPLLFMFHDGWHLHDEIHIATTFISAILIALSGFAWYYYLAVFVQIAIAFNISYHGFLLKKEYRTWFWFI